MIFLIGILGYSGIRLCFFYYHSNKEIKQLNEIFKRERKRILKHLELAKKTIKKIEGGKF